MIATGSPRKRYDKAAKVAAAVLVSVNWKDEQAVASARSMPDSEVHRRVQEILEKVTGVSR
jgi:histidyl-tRNA synthetase